MKLIKITLTNFKGIKSFEFEPGGENASVYGTNGSGKTTLFDALTWLLFDKGSDWGVNFSPKTQNKDGGEVHNLNNRVDGIFSLDDGRLITFSKDQSENWVKKRGGASESLSGNITEYYIDGVPVKKGEYNERIEEICPVSMGQILTQPLYFSDMLDWTRRREILLDVCKDVSEFDVINSNSLLTEITRFLLIPGTDGQFYTVDECQKVFESKGKDIKRRLEEIPARIDEASRALIDSDENAIEVLNGTLELLQSDLNEALNEKAAFNENSVESELRRKAADIKSEISQAKAQFLQKQNDALSEDRDTLKETTEQWQEIAVKKSTLSASIGTAKNKIALLTAQRDQLVKRHTALATTVWQGSTVCPTCKRELPEEEIEAAKEKFNSEKASELEEIRQKIEVTCSKNAIAQLEAEIRADESAYEDLDVKAKFLNSNIQSLRDKIAEVDKNKFEDTSEFENLSENLAEIEAQIASGITDISAEKNEIQLKINRIRADMDNVQMKISALKTNELQKKRIAELEGEEKSLQVALEDIEHCLYLCGEFIKTKVALLTDRINAEFENVRFQLFKEQINGGIKEVCEVLVPTESGTLVPFSKTNDAAKINAGLEIINTLSQKWGVSMPVMVDNAESVVKLKDITPQVIRLVVSGNDKTLRVEREGR